MTPPAKRPRSHARSLLAAISELAATLPSDAERTESIAAIRAVEEYLAGIREWLERLPTSENASDLRGALAKFDSLVERADSNPLISRVLGASPRSRPRKEPAAPSSSPETGKRLLAEMESFSIDQIRERLQTDPLITTQDLRSVAQLLQLRPSSRITREALAHQLTTRISNDRGYRMLSGTQEREPADESPPASGATQ